MLSIVFTPRYMPGCRPCVVYPATVIVDPELVHVAKKVKFVLPVVPDRVFESVMTRPEMLTTVVLAGSVSDPAVFVVTATSIPGYIPAADTTVIVLAPDVAPAAVCTTFAGKAQYFVTSCICVVL
jgi:hypothetical protein